MTDYVDTASGQLVLEYTDLELPGNGGKSLRFGRNYSGRDWHVGLLNLPLRVAPRNQGPQDGYPPSVVMGDGTEHLAVCGSDLPRLPGNCYAPPHFYTAEYWLYDRPATGNGGTVYMPDGTVNFYDNNNRLTLSRDPFGNDVHLLWDGPTNKTVVTQSMGNGRPDRMVVITYYGAGFSGGVATIEFEGKVWQYGYNGIGLTSATSPVGTAWQYTYDLAEHDLLTVTSPYGGTLTYTYETVALERNNWEHLPCPSISWDPSQGPPPPECPVTTRVVHTRQESGQAGSWVYDYDPGVLGTGQLKTITQMTSPSDIRTVFEYTMFYGELKLFRREVFDRNGTSVESEERQYEFLADVKSLPSSVTLRRDGLTHVTTYSYDGSATKQHGRPSTITERTDSGPARTTDILYEPYGTFSSGLPLRLGDMSRQTVSLNGESDVHSWSRDGRGFVTSETAAGLTTTFFPDGYGNVIRVRKGNGTTTDFSYDYGVVSEVRTAAHTTTRVINSDGTIASETQGTRTTSFDYDDLLRPTLSARTGANATTTEYVGNQVTVHRGPTWSTTTLDGFGRVVATATSAGVYTATRYDSDGRKEFESDPSDTPNPQVGTAFEYDALGRVTKRTHTADTTSVETVYGAGVVMVQDEKGRQTFQTQEMFGNPSEARLAAMTDADGNTWSYEYNIAGNLTKVTAPPGPTGPPVIRTWTYKPGKPTLLASETHPESGTVVYDVYDAAGNLKQKHDANGTVFSFTYDGNDRLSQVSMSGPNGLRVLNYTYETGSDNRATAEVVGGAHTQFLYDTAGRLYQRSDSVAGQSTKTQTFTYDGNDNLASITYPDGRLIQYTYDSGDRVTSVRDATPNSTATYDTLLARDFQYKPTGALRRFTTGNGLMHTFDYDGRNRLERIQSGTLLDLQYQQYDPVGNVGRIFDAHANAEQLLEYDRIDRLTHAQGPGYDALYQYDAHGNRVTNVASTYGYDANLRLRVQNNQTFDYDNNGNLTTVNDPAATYTYTPDNQIATSNVGGVQATYQYDADGWRVAKTSNGITSVFLRGPGGQLLSESRAVTDRDYVYAAGKLIAMVLRRRTGTDPAIPSAPSISTDPGTGRRNFGFAATASVSFSRATLKRAAKTVSCTTGDPSGCGFSQVDSEPAPANVTEWTDNTSLTDIPPTGNTYIYKIEVTDIEDGVGSSPAVEVGTVDDVPDAFSFTNQTDLALNTVISSNIVQITGIAGSIPVSVAGGSGTYQVCTTSNCSSGSGFVSTASTITNGQWVQLRVTSSTLFDTAVSTILTVGSVPVSWSARTAPQDNDPVPFSFTTINNAPTSTLLTSNIVQVTGITGSVITNITGGGASYQVCSTANCSSNSGWKTGVYSITDGQYLQLRLTSSAAFSAGTTTTMTVGSRPGTWTVNTAPQDVTPDAFGFTNQSNVSLGTQIYSNVIQITGITGSVATSVSGTGVAYQVCPTAACTSGTGWTASPAFIQNGQYVQMDIVSSGAYGTTESGTLTIGGASTTWSVTTISDPCAGSPAPGTTCADGSKFAGYSPATGTKMYTTTSDIGYQPFAWPETLWGGTNWGDGLANTNGLASFGNYHAANACYNLTANGKSDWYLPSPAEWNAMDPNRYAIGGFLSDETLYWTSAEHDGGDWFGGIYHSIGSDFNGYTGQGIYLSVRCVRRD